MIYLGRVEVYEVLTLWLCFAVIPDSDFFVELEPVRR